MPRGSSCPGQKLGGFAYDAKAAFELTHRGLGVLPCTGREARKVALDTVVEEQKKREIYSLNKVQATSILLSEWYTNAEHYGEDSEFLKDATAELQECFLKLNGKNKCVSSDSKTKLGSAPPSPYAEQSHS